MTRRGVRLLFCALVLLLCAFSTGSPVFLLPAVLFLLMLLYAWLSTYLCVRTLTFETALEHPRIRRGEDTGLQVRLHARSFLPVAPLTLSMRLSAGVEEEVLTCHVLFGRDQVLQCRVHGTHVGLLCPGVHHCTVTDLSGLWCRRVTPGGETARLQVLPLPFDVESLKFAPGDSGLGTMERATEDLSSPEDFRSYQSGDPMKKIHWKLSVRKQELVVRRYEEPTLPEAMVLMDSPRLSPDTENGLRVRDALLETAASVLLHEKRMDHSVRMPLQSSHPMELSSRMEDTLILENLCLADFPETGPFEEVLALETRRMRKIGCTVIITGHLTGNLVDMMISMRRMGPTLRLYLITFQPEDPEIQPMIVRLQNALCEVCYVTPAQKS